MRKISLFLVIVMVIALGFPGQALAHPGNTASDGCHYCETNCAKYGYTEGTRHGHHGEACDPSKGPIDPLYSGRQPVVQPTAPARVATSTPRPTATPTARPTTKPSPTPTLEPTLTPEPTEKISPTQEPSPTEVLATVTPEVKGEAIPNPPTPKKPRTNFWKIIIT